MRHRVGEDTLLLEHESHLKSEHILAHNNWDDGGSRITNIKTPGTKFLHHPLGVGPQLLPPFRLQVDNIQGSTDGGHEGWSQACREHHGPADVFQVLDDVR